MFARHSALFNIFYVIPLRRSFCRTLHVAPYERISITSILPYCNDPSHEPAELWTQRSLLTTGRHQRFIERIWNLFWADRTGMVAAADVEGTPPASAGKSREAATVNHGYALSAER